MDVSMAVMLMGSGFVVGCVFMIAIFGLYLASRDSRDK